MENVTDIFFFWMKKNQCGPNTKIKNNEMKIKLTRKSFQKVAFDALLRRALDQKRKNPQFEKNWCWPSTGPDCFVKVWPCAVYVCVFCEHTPEQTSKQEEEREVGCGFY